MSEYYMFHKPAGCITANRDPRHKTVMDYFPPEAAERLFAVGRLDRDTEGLLIITDDGTLTAGLLHPDRHVEKSYFFYAIGEMTEEKQRRMEEGLSIDMGRSLTKPAKFELCEEKTLGEIFDYLNEEDRKRARNHLQTSVFSGILTVTEGKKHQVKRMLGAVGTHIVYLKRIRMGSLVLDPALPRGAYRPLTKAEVADLYRSVPPRTDADFITQKED